MSSEVFSNSQGSDEAGGAEANQAVKVPVVPVDLKGHYEEGILFSDPELSNWWWESHSFMTIRQRYELARQVVPMCTSKQCKLQFQNELSSLEAELEPTPTGQAFVNAFRSFGRERPLFLAACVVSVIYLLIAAGSNLYGLVSKLG